MGEGRGRSNAAAKETASNRAAMRREEKGSSLEWSGVEGDGRASAAILPLCTLCFMLASEGGGRDQEGAAVEGGRCGQRGENVKEEESRRMGPKSSFRRGAKGERRLSPCAIDSGCFTEEINKAIVIDGVIIVLGCCRRMQTRRAIKKQCLAWMMTTMTRRRRTMSMPRRK